MDKIKIKVNDLELELPKEDVSQGIEKGEISITKEDLLFFGKDEYEKRLKNEKDTEYKKGRKDGVEIEAKELKRKLGVEVEKNDMDMIVSAYRDKIIAENKIEPDKAIEEKNKIIKGLRDNLKAIEDEKNNLLSNFEQKQKETQINSLMFSAIPDKVVTDTFTRNDIIALFNANGYKADIQENKAVVVFNGEVIKDNKTLEPLSVADVVNRFIGEKGLIKSEGRGAKDKTETSRPNTLESFQKEMNDKGIRYGSDEFIREMQSRIANKTLQV